MIVVLSLSRKVCVELMVNPPSGPSLPLYNSERAEIYASLKRRAAKLVAGLQSLDGISCNASGGAMYAFPQVELSPKAVSAAVAADVAPDALCVNSLLSHVAAPAQ